MSSPARWLAAAGAQRAGMAALLSLAAYGGAALGLLLTVLATGWMSAESYGMAALIMGYPTLLWSVASFKPSSIATRYLARYHASQQPVLLAAVFKLGTLLDVAAASLVLLLVWASGWWVLPLTGGRAADVWLMVAYTASLPIHALCGTSQATLVAFRSLRLLALLQLFERVATLLLGVGALAAGFDLAGLVLALALGQAVAGITTLAGAAWVLRHTRGYWRQARIAALTGLRGELAALFGWNYLLVTLTGVLLQLPLLLLGSLRGPAEAGWFRLATTLATVGGYPEQALAKTVYSELAEATLTTSDAATLRNKLWRWTTHLGLPVAALVIAGASLLPLLLPLVFGPQYAPVVPLAQILLLSVALRTACFWLNPLYFASGWLQPFTIGYGIYTVAVIGSSWLLAPVWGAVSIAWLVSGGYSLLLLALALPQLLAPRWAISIKGSSQ